MTTRYFTMVLYLIVNIICGNADIGGYFWREYTGDIPEDAYPGGRDFNGKPVYIAQTLFEDKVIPGYIKETQPNTVYFEWFDNQKVATKFIKILCTQEPDRMQWVSTKHDELHLLTNKHLILGGYESTFSTYIGRSLVSDETLVGKVVASETESFGLDVARNGKGLNFATFEILTFDRSKNVLRPIDIDVRFTV